MELDPKKREGKDWPKWYKGDKDKGFKETEAEGRKTK